MILIDTNVWTDVLVEDVRWRAWSEERVLAASDRGQAAINPIIYTELTIGFPSDEALRERVPERSVRYLDLPYEAAFAAGRAFAGYKQRGGAKTSPLPDFYIGAHARAENLTILTRDARRYQTYFPDVRLITPD